VCQGSGEVMVLLLREGGVVLLKESREKREADAT
jgi:hypothetical protein